MPGSGSQERGGLSEQGGGRGGGDGHSNRSRAPTRQGEQTIPQKHQPDTPLPCTGTGAACCEMIIFCFLPVQGLTFSSSSEEKEWENIAAFIPPRVLKKLPFYESPFGFEFHGLSGAGGPP